MRAWPVQASPGHSGAERAVRTRMTTGRDVLLAFWTAVHVLERSGARRCFQRDSPRASAPAGCRSARGRSARFSTKVQPAGALPIARLQTYARARVASHHASCRQAVARLMPRAVSSPISACRFALATHACRTAAVSPSQRSASRHRLFAHPAAILMPMKHRGGGAMRPIQGIGALLLMACSGAAMALGLGDIRVLSSPGNRWWPRFRSSPTSRANSTARVWHWHRPLRLRGSAWSVRKGWSAICSSSSRRTRAGVR